jgi:hypothetical protein
VHDKEHFSMSPGGWRFTLRQMSDRASIRVLTAYVWTIAVTGFVLVVITGSHGQAPLNGRNWPALDAIGFELFAYLRGVCVAVVAIAGAILVHSLLPAKATEVLDDFSQRFFGYHFARHVRPIHGALLIAKLSIIVPSSLAIGLLLNAKSSAANSHLLGVMIRFIVGTLLVSIVCGFGAVWLSQKKHKWALSTWSAIWLVPEGLRMLHADIPTCRSLIVGFLTAITQPWGMS